MEDGCPASVAAASTLGVEVPEVVPYAGSLRPMGDLAVFEGHSLTGVWTLEVRDGTRNVTGTLDGWARVVRREV